MSIEQVLRTDLNNSEIRYTKITYFPDRGCVHTLLTLYVYATAPLSPCNHKNINCRSHWTDQGRIERGTPTPGHLCMWKIVLIFTVKNMLKFENFWKCTPEMYFFKFLNTPLGGERREHRRLPQAANTLAPPLPPATRWAAQLFALLSPVIIFPPLLWEIYFWNAITAVEMT